MFHKFGHCKYCVVLLSKYKNWHRSRVNLLMRSLRRQEIDIKIISVLTICSRMINLLYSMFPYSCVSMYVGKGETGVIEAWRGGAK